MGANSRLGSYSNKYGIRPHLLWVNALVNCIPNPQTPADSGDLRNSGANMLILHSFLALAPGKLPNIYSYAHLSPGWGVS